MSSQPSKNSIMITFFALIVFGLIILSSATSVIGFTNFNDNYYFFKHQLLFGLLPGMFLFLVCLKIPYQFWQKNAKWIFGGCLLLLLLVLMPGVSTSDNYAHSWINLGKFSFQPAEIAKLGLIIFLSAWFAHFNTTTGYALKKQQTGVKTFSQGLLPFLIFTGLVAGLIALQPDVGTAFIVIIIAVTMYFVAGARWSHLFGLGLLGAGTFGLLVLTAPYRLNRILAFLNPSLDTQGIGYHVNQALLAVGSGGLFGLGLGKSRQKFEYLPEIAGDSIFAVMAEEIGFIFSCLFIILLFSLIIKMLKSSFSAPDDFGKYFCVGMAVWIGGQSLFNIGAMLGILPLTGVPLPFISYGGTALMTLMAGCGILMNIVKQS